MKVFVSDTDVKTWVWINVIYTLAVQMHKMFYESLIAAWLIHIVGSSSQLHLAAINTNWWNEHTYKKNYIESKIEKSRNIVCRAQ